MPPQSVAIVSHPKPEGWLSKRQPEKFVNKTNADMGVDKVLQKNRQGEGERGGGRESQHPLIELHYTLDCPLNGCVAATAAGAAGAGGTVVVLAFDSSVTCEFVIPSSAKYYPVSKNFVLVFRKHRKRLPIGEE